MILHVSFNQVHQPQPNAKQILRTNITTIYFLVQNATPQDNQSITKLIHQHQLELLDLHSISKNIQYFISHMKHQNMTLT